MLSRSVMSISCHPMDCSLPGSCVHGNPPGENTGAGACCLALLQRIFPTQGANPGLPHCRMIFYHLCHQGNPNKVMEDLNNAVNPCDIIDIYRTLYPIIAEHTSFSSIHSPRYSIHWSIELNLSRSQFQNLTKYVLAL